MHIVIIGNVCIDKNTTEHAQYTAAGGPGVFMQKIFSQIPAVETTIIAPYGKDFLPFKSDLPLFPKNPIGEKTLVYENVMEGLARKQKAYNRESAVLLPIDKPLQNLLAHCDILYVSPLLPNLIPSYIGDIVRYTKKDTLKILLPQGYYRSFMPDDSVVVRQFEEANEILPLMDIVIVSEQDMNDMLTTADAWSETYSTVCVVTMGEKGAVIVSGKQTIDVPTSPVPVEEIVDSVGSGDIFSASFGYAYKKTGSLEKAGQFANVIARQCLFFTPDNIRIDKDVITL